ncbi:MAG: hypothetical protein IT561_00990 [Alphaproteobacteria bacterium]|nr:hypothetical protein [Alphaproteobacteria bacterium]
MVVGRVHCAGWGDDIGVESGVHWADDGVRLVDLAHHELLLPFLVRLRYEAFGDAPGQLWTMATNHVEKQAQPWALRRQRLGATALAQIREQLANDLGASPPPGAAGAPSASSRTRHLGRPAAPS